MRGCIPTEEVVLLGAFQRRGDVATSLPMRRRATGGTAVRLGPGTVWLQEDFHGLPPDKILNRAVRPVLDLLTRTTKKKVSYFGRDWLAVNGRPVALVSFAYEKKRDHGILDVFVSARSLVTLGARASYRGKEPMTLDVDPEKLVETASSLATFEVDDDPPWEATAEDAIGLIGAGHDRHGVMRVGGELMASSDVDHVAGEHDPALFGTTSEMLEDVLRKTRR